MNEPGDVDLPVVACVGAIVRDAQGRLLMIRRRHAPSAGLWSVPGGRIEVGESPEEAIVREVLEETGLVVRVESLVGSLLIPAEMCVYDVHDYACVVDGGQLTAGDDAAEARWVDLADLDALPTPPGFLDTVKPWL